jgi:hypothetical protein
MKSLEIIAHTAGGEVRSAVEQVTERMYEDTKTSLKNYINGPYLEFDTDNGCVVIPTSQVLYVEIHLY